MSGPLLVTCRGIPGYGGASTYAYVLFEVLRGLGFPAHYVTMVNPRLARLGERHFGAQWWNPAGLPDVHLFVAGSYSRREQPVLGNILRRLRPRLVIAKNDIAPRLVRHALNGVETWFLTSSSKPMKAACTRGFAKSLEDGMAKLGRGVALPWGSARERSVVHSCDRVFCDSEVTRICFARLYPEHAHKIHPRAFWSASTFQRKLGGGGGPRQRFSSRSIDLLFIANRWNRNEKEYPLVKALIRDFRGRNIHVVGRAREKADGARYHGIVPHARVLELMAQAKTVVSTSSYDSSPNILFEGALMGCNVVASKNCGNWSVCHPELLVEPHHRSRFIEKARLSLTRKFDANLAPFVDDDPLEEFVELVRMTLRA
jgi:glycosyltransferase involved in cell wall biosynthesis